MLRLQCLNGVARTNVAIMNKQQFLGLTIWSRCRGSVVACPALAIADAIAIVGGCGPAGASVRLGLLPGGQAEAGPAVPQHQRSHTGTTSEAEE